MMLRKLIRTMKLYKAQFISMIIMTALGIGTFVGFNIEWYSLERDTQSFFKKTGFADYRLIRESGFSAEEAAEISAIEGVDGVTRYLSVKTVVKDSADVISLTVTENENVSGLMIMSGQSYDPADKEGFWLSDRYAFENGVTIGDLMTLVYKDIEISGKVKGLVKSGEYLICVPDETQLMPDYSTYGFVYISPLMLKESLGKEYYPQINVISRLEKKEFSEKADAALGETLLLLGKEDTISYSEAQGESREGKTMALILPVLFLAISVLTMITTMHRMAAAEKTQIGTLKSLGFKNKRIMRHYALYGGIPGLIGTLFGIVIGLLLGWFIMNPGGAMGTYLDMPSWKLSAPPFVYIVLVFIVFALFIIGALSVKTMISGTAADALRPYTPKKVKKVLLEKTPLWDKMSFGTRWNIRDCLRHKTRSLMTLFGVVGCMILVVASMGMQDTLDEFVDSFYNRSIRYSTRIVLDPSNTDRATAKSIADRYEGDTCAQLNVQMNGVSLGLEIYGIEHDLVRFLSSDTGYVTLGKEGAYVCERIARDNNLSAGEVMTVSPFGSSQKYDIVVSGVIRSLTKCVVMSEEYADSVGIPYSMNTVYTSENNVSSDEHILSTQTKQSIVDSFDTFMEIMKVMIWLLIAAAVILGIVVLYDLGVMSYTERYREMAALKVLGFKDKKIGKLLIGQNLMLSFIGMIIGVPAGIGTLKYLMYALASEYELRISLSFMTFAVSILLVLAVTLAVSLMVSRKNRNINMVEALKVQE